MGSHSKADPEYIKEVLNPLKKDGLEFRPKNRSLLNPNQKEGRVLGLNFKEKKENDLNVYFISYFLS